jgi:hypothetical protein
MWDCEFQPLISPNIIDREHYLLLRGAGSSYLGNILREGKSLTHSVIFSLLKAINFIDY